MMRDAPSMTFSKHDDPRLTTLRSAIRALAVTLSVRVKPAA
jgi:hypothetical protein